MFVFSLSSLFVNKQLNALFRSILFYHPWNNTYGQIKYFERSSSESPDSARSNGGEPRDSAYRQSTVHP